jgi:hypothetical protein
MKQPGRQQDYITYSDKKIPEDKYLLYTNPNSFSFTLSPFSDSVLDEQEMFRLRHVKK